LAPSAPRLGSRLRRSTLHVSSSSTSTLGSAYVSEHVNEHVNALRNYQIKERNDVESFNTVKTMKTPVLSL